MSPASRLPRSIISIFGVSCLIGGLSAQARADDCAPVKAAMLATVKKPVTITIHRIKDGKPVTNRMVQTNDAKYVEINGKWHSMPVSADDLREMEKSFSETIITCKQVGSDSVGGKSATIYTGHYKNDDTEGDAKLWIGSDGLPLKADTTIDGETISSSYDFAHADAPAESTPLGKQ